MANPGPATTTTTNLVGPYGNATFIETLSVSLTPLIVATITAPEQSFGLNGVSQVTAATGILAGDTILSINPPSVTAGVAIASYRADATTNDKFYIQFVNPTAGGLTPPSGTYKITVARAVQGSTTAAVL
jgi:hypothetical protein